MFGMLTSLIKSSAAVVTVPVAIAADIVTLGGVFTDREEPYTAEAVSDFVKNVQALGKPEKK